MFAVAFGAVKYTQPYACVCVYVCLTLGRVRTYFNTQFVCVCDFFSHPRLCHACLILDGDAWWFTSREVDVLWVGRRSASALLDVDETRILNQPYPC